MPCAVQYCDVFLLFLLAIFLLSWLTDGRPDRGVSHFSRHAPPEGTKFGLGEQQARVLIQ
jgi:hypothetical protein